MTRFYAAFAVVIAMTCSAVGISLLLDADPEHNRPPHAAPADARVSIGPLPLAVVGADQPGEVIVNVSAWVEGELREQERLAEEAAAEAERLRAARSTPNVPVARPGTREGVGDCTGFAIPDYIIQRESGGNPWAVNPSSGAFGCAQVMPFHWAPGGACAGLDRWSIEDQRTCVDWLSQGGTRLSPWAATR